MEKLVRFIARILGVQFTLGLSGVAYYLGALQTEQLMGGLLAGGVVLMIGLAIVNEFTSVDKQD